ncbi:MAG TPA: DUF1799 domain-containing protein [Accumulibacter sp.]|nr:DUF1799 domain-containing protein [Accumulibacter sp.]
MAAFGLRPEDVADPPLAIWPDNVAAVRVFMVMATQWRLAPMGGVIGLRYEALPVIWHVLSIGSKTRRQVFADLRVMEASALAVLNKD